MCVDSAATHFRRAGLWRLRYLGFMGLEPEAERQRGWGEKELAFNPALW